MNLVHFVADKYMLRHSIGLLGIHSLSWLSKMTIPRHFQLSITIICDSSVFFNKAISVCSSQECSLPWSHSHHKKTSLVYPAYLGP